MRRVLIAFSLAVVVVALAAFAWWYRSRSRPIEEAYVGERRAIVWSSTAQVRESLATVHFGDKIAVLGHYGDRLHVRTAQGVTGWMNADQVLAPELWARITGLTEQAGKMPVQGRGRTRVLSNLHLEPGRTTEHIGQLTRDVPVEVLERATALWAGGAEEAPSSEQGQAEPRREDWLLVRARLPELGPIAGWVLGRFVQYDLPDPIPIYASAAGMRVVAWFALNQVNDARSGTKPQYLVVGSKGPEGQPCDFTMLRVFTWGSARQRYETAYIESGLCGHLPVQVTPTSQPGGDTSFRFTDTGARGQHELNYRMHQTVVRRVREGEKASRGSRPR
jgi:hypothetical protein